MTEKPADFFDVGPNPAATELEDLSMIGAELAAEALATEDFSDWESSDSAG